MKPLIIFLILCAVAVGVSVSLTGQQGYVEFFIPPATKVTLSLSLAISLLIGLFFLLFAVIHFLKFAIALPHQAKQYRENKRKEKAKQELQQAVAAMIEGRYDQTLLLTEKSFDADDAPELNRLIAARAAHHMGQIEDRDKWFEAAAQKPEFKKAVEVSRAALLTDAKDFAGVEAAINQVDIKERSRLSYRLLIKAYFAQEKWQEALEFLRDFGRRGDRNKEQVAQAKRIAQHHILGNPEIDKAQMDIFWHLTPDDERNDPVILADFIRCALRLEDYVFIRRQVESFLERDWDGPLVRLYGSFLDPNAKEVQLERLVEWQKTHEDDADLIFALGMLHMKMEQWEEAQKYLEQSLQMAHCIQTEIALADVYDHTSKHKKASEIYRHIAVGHIAS